MKNIRQEFEGGKDTMVASLYQQTVDVIVMSTFTGRLSAKLLQYIAM